MIIQNKKTKKPSEMTLEEFNEMLNEDPKPEIIEINEDLYKHIPIAFLEADLRKCFEGRVEFQKTQTQMIFNAVDCDAIIRVFHPVLKEYQTFYGPGTVLIESVSQGKYANSQTVVKANNESMATALAFAEGKKSAARQIGTRFGSNLNRTNKPGRPQKESFKVTKKKTVDARAGILIDDCKSIAELNALMPTLPNTEEVQEALNKKLISLKQNKKQSK